MEPPRATPVLGAMQRVIPAPISIEPAAGNGFVFTAETVILAEPKEDVMRVARYLAAAIGPAAGPGELRVEPRTAAARAGAVELALKPATRSAGDALDEGYELSIAPERVTIVAPRRPGCSTACRRCVSCCRRGRVSGRAGRQGDGRSPRPPGASPIAPRFAWRGAMLDVARHFFGRRRQALHRSDGAVQAQSPAPAPRRRSGLAHRDQVVAEPRDARRQHRGRRRTGRLLHAGAIHGHRRATRRRATSRSCRRSTCRATPTPRSRRSRAELQRRGAAALHRHRGRLQRALRREGRHLHGSSTMSSARSRR